MRNIPARQGFFHRRSSRHVGVFVGRRRTHDRAPRRSISPELIASIRNAIRLEDAVSERIPLRRSGKVFVGSCPWHESKSGRSFVVYPDQQTWRCWGCAIGGDVFSFFERFASMSFPAAVRLVAKSVGIEVDVSADESTDDQVRALTELQQVETSIAAILNAEFGRVADSLDRRNRMEARASNRLAELSMGAPSRFVHEREWCWCALECAYAALRLDAEYSLLAFGKPDERERFCATDAKGRQGIIDEILVADS
jgi:hypothetical protein